MPNCSKTLASDAPPTTWEEVEEQCIKLKENGIAVPIALEFAQAMPTTLENFTAMVFGRGGELLDENLDPILDDPAGAAYAQLTWLAKMNEAGLVALLPHETDVVKAMNTGQHAFTVLYNYNLAELNNAATSPLAGQFKLAIMPGGSGQTYGFAKFYSMTKMAVDRGQEAMDAAWKFIEYFGGEVDGQFGVAKTLGGREGPGLRPACRSSTTRTCRHRSRSGSTSTCSRSSAATRVAATRARGTACGPKSCAWSWCAPSAARPRWTRRWRTPPRVRAI